jgi:hypothetical protein
VSLAFAASLIQRKRINIFSTACAALLAACSGGASSTSTSGSLTLSPVAATVLLSPGQQGSATFLLTDARGPVAGTAVSFTIAAGVPGSAEGATLAAASATTNAAGVVSVEVRAGLATDFGVTAKAGTAEAQVAVIVHSGASASVLLAPYFTPQSQAASRAVGLRVLLYDDAECSSLSPAHPPTPTRPAVTLTSVPGTAEFDFVGTSLVSAAIAQATDATGQVVANGCIDIPGSALLAGSIVQIALPLVDATPDPVGSYTVTSTFAFSPRLAAAGQIGAAWGALGACPLDPAELWLDCATDALATSASDPLDCVPSAVAGGEGAVGTAVAAVRGTALVDGTGTPTGCRSAHDAAGDESVDALLTGAFGSPTPAALVALPAIASEAAALLDGMQLTSSLDIAPSSVAGVYVATHTLGTALFGPNFTVSVPLAPLALPTLTATATAQVAGGVLAIGSHGFTLRLGTVARAAFGALSLAPRGLPSSPTGFVTAVAALAKAPDGASGCAALDEIVCARSGLASGCLATACAAGLAALAAELDAGFTAADGTGVDLALSGSTPLVENHDDGYADRLGAADGDTEVATWSADVWTAAQHVKLSASFEGVRQ